MSLPQSDRLFLAYDKKLTGRKKRFGNQIVHASYKYIKLFKF